MQRKQILIGSLLLVVMSSFSACFYDNEEYLYGITPNANCELGDVKYSVQVVSILQQNCYACHSNGSNLGNLLLDSYTTARSAAINGSLMGSVKHQAGYSAMPQAAGKLQDCDIQALQTWVDAGTPNN